MLVLSRRIGETIQIDDVITLEVLQCSNGRVKLGITAPASKRIVRSEAGLRPQDFLQGTLEVEIPVDACLELAGSHSGSALSPL